MAERKCSRCGELFLPEKRKRVCPDCIGDRGPRDCVTHFSMGESYRLAAGLRMNRGDQ